MYKECDKPMCQFRVDQLEERYKGRPNQEGLVYQDFLKWIGQRNCHCVCLPLIEIIGRMENNERMQSSKVC
jgi:hypothetical protein